MHKLQYLNATYNLLTYFQTEKNQTHPVYQESQLKLGIYRQGNYCNNLTTKAIPFFIVSKSAVGETISKLALPHFSKHFSIALKFKENELSCQIQNFMMS